MAAKASAKSSRKEPVAAPASSGAAVKGSKRKLAVAAAVDPPPKQLSLEERTASLEERLLKAESDARRRMEVAHRDVLARAEELRATQRRLLERTGLMRAIADMSQDPMFVVGRELTYVIVNQAFARLLESPPDRLIGSTHSAELPRDLARLAHERDAQVLATGQASVHNETIELGDGVTHDVVTTRSPWLVDGEIAGVIGFARDVTERNPLDRMRDRRLAASQAAELSARATLERLFNQNRRLQELDRTKDDLLATISHDFRTPLTSIMGYAQLIQRQSDKEAQHMRAVGVILSESERMAGIVKKIGRITKYETTDYVGSTRMLDLDRATTSGSSDPAIPVMTEEPHEDKTGEFQAVTPTEESGLQHPSLADLVDLDAGHGKGPSR